MKILSFDCGMNPLAWVLVEISDDGFVAKDKSTYHNIRMLNRALEYFNDMSSSRMTTQDRVSAVIDYMKRDVQPILEDGMVILIEQQIAPAARASACTIPYDVFVTLCAYFMTKGYVVNVVHSSLKLRLDMGVVICPAQEYASRYYANKMEACLKYDYVREHMGGSEIRDKMAKKDKNHIADAFMQMMAWYDANVQK